MNRPGNPIPTAQKATAKKRLQRCILLTPLILVLLCAPSARADVSTWTIGPGGSTSCGNPIATDGAGNVYVYDGTFNDFRRYGPEGSEGALIGIGQTRLLARAPDGGMYFVRTDPLRLAHLASDGASLPDVLLTGSPEFRSGPVGIATTPAGDVYLLDVRTAQVRKFGPTGAFERAWGSSGSEPGQFNFYNVPGNYSIGTGGIAIGTDGKVLVYDRSARVQVFDANGTFLRQWGGLGTGPTQFLDIYGIATNPSGRVFVGGGDRRTDAGRALGGIRSFTEEGSLTGMTDYLYSWSGAWLSTFGDDLVYESTCNSVIRYELRTPNSVKGTAEPLLAVPGQNISITASASVPFGRIANYDFDLDGDGQFETTSVSGTVTTSYSTTGGKSIAVRATSDRGGQAVGYVTQRLQVVTAPPTGLVGISIDGGDFATNTDHVQITPVWALGTGWLRLSNDGSFSGATSFPVQPTISWRLARGSNQQSTRIVYARFDDGANIYPPTYTDDIVLDKTAPNLLSATSSVARSSARKRTYPVTIRAEQRRSGISAAQFSTSKSGGKTISLRSLKVRGITRLKKTMAVPTNKAPRFIRVQSAAGTWSSWKPIRRR